jgi:hypothetical protein
VDLLPTFHVDDQLHQMLGCSSSLNVEGIMLQKRRRIRLAIVIFCTCATSLAGLLASAGTAFASDKNMCSASIANPHVSTGAGGVIAKGQWSCLDTPTTIFLDFTHGSAGLNLWLCTDKAPEKTETYLEDDGNCIIWGSNYENIKLTGPSSVTRSVPPSPEPGGIGDGWWVACAVWASQGPLGTGSPVTTFSNVVYINNV